jgi:hypothetical protein
MAAPVGNLLQLESQEKEGDRMHSGAVVATESQLGRSKHDAAINGDVLYPLGVLSAQERISERSAIPMGLYKSVHGLLEFGRILSHGPS